MTGEHREGCRVLADTLSFNAHAGANAGSFGGRISRGLRLRPGRCTLEVTARDAAGATTAPQRPGFTIVQ